MAGPADGDRAGGGERRGAARGTGRTLCLGELGLDGELRSIDGAASVALMAMEREYRRLLVPEANAPEAAVAAGGK